ncbi:hypothetical protein CF326_g3457 [Tilletia indica]|nr:hypothetical protein CF326_g3457 [Tilletia indica]
MASGYLDGEATLVENGVLIPVYMDAPPSACSFPLSHHDLALLNVNIPSGASAGQCHSQANATLAAMVAAQAAHKRAAEEEGRPIRKRARNSTEESLDEAPDEGGAHQRI